MNKIRRFLNSTRKELLIQILSIFFAILISDPTMQLIVLGAGIAIISFMLWIESKTGTLSINGTSSRLFKLTKWVLLSGVVYFSTSYAWILGVIYFLGSDQFILLFFVLLIFSLGLSVLPTKLFTGKSMWHHNWFWFMSFGGSLLLLSEYSINNLIIFLIFPLAIIIVGFIKIPKILLWMLSNSISGCVFALILSLAFISGIPSQTPGFGLILDFTSNEYWWIYLIFASLSSSVITGLAFISLIEENPEVIEELTN